MGAVAPQTNKQTNEAAVLLMCQVLCNATVGCGLRIDVSKDMNPMSSGSSSPWREDSLTDDEDIPGPRTWHNFPQHFYLRHLRCSPFLNIPNVKINHNYFYCYTVHVAESLNHYTNHCTCIKFIKFTHWNIKNAPTCFGPKTIIRELYIPC